MKGKLRIGLEFLGLLIVAALVVLAAGLLSGRKAEPTPAPGQAESYPPPATEAAVAQATGAGVYPPPIVESLPVTLTWPITQTEKIEFVEKTPTPGPTAWPTFTPFPSPTLRPGATNTPIPLMKPAENPSGNICFLSLQTDGRGILSIFEVDDTGKELNKPSLLADQLTIPYGWVFPSPDKTLFAITGNWGAGSILETSTGKLFPLETPVALSIFFNWFPDNQRTLIRDDSGNLILVNLFNGEHVPIFVPGYGAVDGAVASPDGNQIVYSYKKDYFSGPTGLWAIGSDGRNAHLISQIDSTVTNLSWSPDGEKILFYGDGWTIIRSDGSNLKKIDGNFGLPQCYFIPPVWSPDSHIVAIVTSDRGDAFCGEWGDEVFDGSKIVLIDTENGESRLLLKDGSHSNIDPSWSPDGSHIVFISNISGEPEIWIINVDGSNLRQITNDGKYKRFPIWSMP